MRVDITMVLFRPDMAELSRTFESLRLTKPEFRLLHVLLSGSNEARSAVTALLADAGLEDRTRVTHRYDNLGFSSGHNRLLRNAFDDGADAALVLNPDMRIARGALAQFVDDVVQEGSASLFGPSLARVDADASPAPSPARIETDSMGVGWSGDGRHFDIGQGEPFRIEPDRVASVPGLTGACLLVPRGAFERIVATTGWFFDDLFLAYREDAELGVRAAAVGVESKLIHVDGFAHVRSVRGYARGRALPDLLGVRNRYLLKYRLGQLRPSSLLGATVRDVLVAGATTTIERGSLAGLRSAFALRRFARGTSTLRRPTARASGSQPLRVLYLGVESTDYPRNARIRAYLEEQFGAEITVVDIDKDPGGLRKGRLLIQRGSAFPRGSFDIVVLAEFQLKYAVIAKLLAARYRAVLIVDWFVGLYETRVEDWNLAAPGSSKARLWRAIDTVAARIGDFVVTDTDQRARMLVDSYGAKKGRAFALPVGAPDWAEKRSDRLANSEPLKVLYYGGYLPLHGVEYTLDALNLTADPTRFALTCIGKGERRALAEARVSELGLEGQVTFRDPVPEAQLADEIEKSDVVLGVFGSSPKAASVIANKVWQGLACGRPVVTRESPALQEIAPIVGQLLTEVDPSEPSALARVLDGMLEYRGSESPAPSRPLEAYVESRFGEFFAHPRIKQLAE